MKLLKKAKSFKIDLEELEGLLPEKGGAHLHAPDVEVSLTPLGLYKILISDEDLRACTEKLFENEHYASAVEDACKCLNNWVQKRINSQRDGSDLMKYTFSVNAPKLKFNKKMVSKTEQAEQQGYMELFSGCMTGIRNPRAHRHDLNDHPEKALEMLVLVNHLMTKAKAAIRARTKKTT